MGRFLVFALAALLCGCASSQALNGAPSPATTVIYRAAQVVTMSEADTGEGADAVAVRDGRSSALGVPRRWSDSSPDRCAIALSQGA